jgi:2,4-dienoyl-CoA reductase-like NADH-dependent reductase (Old Yellow Enzyme family)/NADPH-dependent 2,4-dienoyl-CoA reductase/sulfur reductase-like enzyme
MKEYPAVFSPLKIKNLVLKNRIVLPPMATWYATSFGEVTERLISYHRERAAGGVGLNIVEFTVVEPHGKLDLHMLGVYDDAQIPGLTALAQAVHEAGGKIALQLGHAGRRARSSNNRGRRPWAPSPIAELGGEIPSEMNQAQIDYVQECFQKAARRAKQAGVDAVEVHCAHGYLIHQFLSPLSNRRTDPYGGSLENRSRFALQTVARVREAVGDEFPVFCRISGDEFIDGGACLDEAKVFAKSLEAAGVDCIDVSAGVYETAERTIPPMAMERGCNIGLAGEVKSQVKVPVIGVGRIKTLDLAETILQNKVTDLVAMGRALIADPELLKKSRVGGNIRPCIACNQGCIERLYQGVAIACLVNARAGREYQIPSVLEKAPRSKTIAVIGGGPAGLEFARVAAERGHKVTLFEQGTELGGRLRIAANPPNKGEIQEFIDYLERAISELGVEIKLGASVTAEEVAGMQEFDEVVVAAGAEPICPPLPESKLNVVFAEDVLQNKAQVGLTVVVLGGGMVGCETAEWLALAGKKVMVVEQLPQLASDLEVRTRKLLLNRLEEHKVDTMANTRVESVETNKVICSQAGVRFEIEGVDTLVLALGYKANGLLAQSQPKKLHRIGDCTQPRKAMAAVHEGFLLGTAI